jgi:hypothetical protein
MHAEFVSENLNKRGYLENLGVDRKTILGWILRKLSGKMWIGCTWLRIGTSGRLL